MMKGIKLEARNTERHRVEYVFRKAPDAAWPPTPRLLEEFGEDAPFGFKSNLKGNVLEVSVWTS